jgi:lambda family phage portal protein
MPQLRETAGAKVGRSYPSPAALVRVRNEVTGYTAAGVGRRSRGWSAPTKSPNDILSSLSLLRDRSRAATRNDPFAKSGLNKLVSNIIGTGIKPMSLAPDPEFRKRVHVLWDRWCDECDAAGRVDLYGLQGLAVRGWMEAGETFVRMRPRMKSDGLTVPLQLQVLEPDFCPVNYSVERGANRIRAGIELSPIGTRVAYWMHRDRPGDPTDMDGGQAFRVDAGEVIHLYELLRAGQLRGVPQAATVLLKLHDLDKFDDATLLRQQLANLFAGFITRGATPDGPAVDPFNGEEVERDDNDNAIVGLEPGAFQALDPGDDVTFSEPPDPSQTYPDFMRQQLLSIATGLEIPYEVLTGDMRGVNDRTVRVVLNEFRRRVEQWQHQVVVFQLCRPVWQAWFTSAVISDALEVPAAFHDDLSAFTRVKWVPQGWAYINPVQEVQAHRDAVRAGFKSRAEVISEQGYDVEAVDAEIAADQKRADELGLVLDTDARKTSRAGGTQARPAGSEIPGEGEGTDAGVALAALGP